MMFSVLDLSTSFGRTLHGLALLFVLCSSILLLIDLHLLNGILVYESVQACDLVIIYGTVCTFDVVEEALYYCRFEQAD